MPRLRYLLLALALAAAACGSSDNGNSGGTTTTASDATTTSADGGDNSGGDTDEPADTDAAWEEILAAAADEGTVTLYTPHLPNQQEALKEAFAQAHPEIELEIVRVLSELEATLDAERQTNADSADVAVTNLPTLARRYNDEGVLIPLDVPAAEAWAGNANLFDNTYFTVNFNAIGIMWNTNELGSDFTITGYEDLLTDELQGRIGITDADGSAVLTDFYAFVEENHGGEQMLRDLAATNPIVYDSAVPLQQATIVGETAVGLYATPSVLAEKAAGAPIDFVLPDPAWAAPFIAFGLDNAGSPNAALVLLNFMLSPEGQEALAINGASALDGVPGLATYDQVVESKVGNREEGFVDTFSAHWVEIFNR